VKLTHTVIINIGSIQLLMGKNAISGPGVFVRGCQASYDHDAVLCPILAKGTASTNTGEMTSWLVVSFFLIYDYQIA
jgi:hypothetical protein